MPSAPPKFSRPMVTALVALLLALHAWLALEATIDLGITADEPAHLVGGYSYWRFDDYRLQPENGNLPQRWAALPLLIERPHLKPAEAPGYWKRSHVWMISHDFLFASGNNTDFMLLSARAAMLAWSLAAGLLVFFWSKALWGARGGLLSLGLYGLSPTTLAHAPLVTSDMCAAFTLLAATAAWSSLTRQVTLRTVALSLLAVAAAAVAKFSCVLLLPIGAVICGWRVLSPNPIALGRRQVSSRAARLGLYLALGATHLVFAGFVVWMCFGFRFSPAAPGLPVPDKYFVAWAEVMPASGIGRVLFEFARSHHVLPDAYLQGFAYVLQAAQERGAFAAGHFSATGWRWFFPYAFLVKSTLTELVVSCAVLVLGGMACLRTRAGNWYARFDPLVPLLAFALVYGGFSIFSHLNIGQRHILPLYLVLFIAAGLIVRTATQRRGWFVSVAIGVAAILEVVSIRPHYLAFFNQLAGGPQAGWRQLVDSSLDWGQNLPRLAEWLHEHRQPGEPVFVSMFGSDDPAYHGVEGRELSPYYSFGRRRQWMELTAGIYCVSATMLQDVYSPYAGPWTSKHELIYRRLLPTLRAELKQGTRSPDLGEFGLGAEQLLWNLDRARFARLCVYLRARPADAVIGHSIFVFRLTQAEVDSVVEGSFTELARAAAQAATLRVNPSE